MTIKFASPDRAQQREVYALSRDPVVGEQVEVLWEEPGEGDELKAIAHGRQLGLKVSNGVSVEVLAPVEGGRAVVGEELARVDLVDGLRELPRLGEVGRRGLAPDDVGVIGVGDAAGDRSGELALERIHGEVATDASGERTSPCVRVLGRST